MASNLLFIKTMAHLILASGSPRRQELLTQLGVAFSTFSPDIDESVAANEPAAAYVERLACEKAQAVLQHAPDAVILAADTSVSILNQIIGKPRDKQHAFEIWSLLSGRSHQVLTGVCVMTARQQQSLVVSTEVEFQHLSLQDMERYWATTEPMGKAGAYAIQGIAAQFIPRIHGSYSNVVGLPLHETAQLLKAVQLLD